MTKYALALTTCLALVAFAPAQTEPPQKAPEMQPMNQISATDADSTFLKTIAEADMAEVVANKLVASKSDYSKVRAAARMMVRDHSKHLADVKNLAASLNVDLPTEPNDEHKALVARLKGESSTTLNKDFVGAQLSDHIKVLNTLMTEADSGGNAKVVALAKKSIPVVRHHAMMWNNLAPRYDIPKETIPGDMDH